MLNRAITKYWKIIYLLILTSPDVYLFIYNYIAKYFVYIVTVYCVYCVYCNYVYKCLSFLCVIISMQEKAKLYYFYLTIAIIVFYDFYKKLKCRSEDEKEAKYEQNLK